MLAAAEHEFAVVDDDDENIDLVLAVVFEESQSLWTTGVVFLLRKLLLPLLCAEVSVMVRRKTATN